MEMQWHRTNSDVCIIEEKEFRRTCKRLRSGSDFLPNREIPMDSSILLGLRPTRKKNENLNFHNTKGDGVMMLSPVCHGESQGSLEEAQAALQENIPSKNPVPRAQSCSYQLFANATKHK